MTADEARSRGLGCMRGLLFCLVVALASFLGGGCIALAVRLW